MSMQISSYDSLDYLNAGLEVSQVELKKQSNQAQRFANKELAGHAQLGDVQNALKVLQPEQLLKVLQNTQLALNGQGATTITAQQDMPQLAAPQSIVADTYTSAFTRSAEKSSNNAAMLTALMGKMAQLSSETTIASQLTRLQGFNAMLQGAAITYGLLANKIVEQAETWATDVDAVSEAKIEAARLQSEVTKAETELGKAKDKLTTAKKALDDLRANPPKAESNPPSDKDAAALLQYQVDLAKLVLQVKLAQTAVTVAQSKVEATTKAHKKYVTETLNPAIEKEKASRKALQDTQAKVVSLVATLTPQQQTVIEARRKQDDENAKSLTFLMALMSQLIDQSASEDLKASAELKQKLSEAAAKEAQKKADEYEAEMRKAEEMQKTMGCIGKVLGWLITAVSFAAALFTGGASLALAAVGLALMIGDEINQAVNGNSFMADAMQPIMEAIVQPLMEALGDMFAKLLEEMGVDPETAKMVGTIMGAIAAAAVLVAGVMVAGSVISKISTELMKKVGSSVIAEFGKKVLNNAAGQMFKRMGQGLGRNMGMNEVKMMKVANYSQTAVVGTQLANTSIQTAGNIVAADMRVDAAKAKAEMIKNAALQDLLNEMMSRAVEVFSSRMESVNAIIRNISVVADNQMQAGKYITKQMSSIAG
ncbi:type III secretion system translocon subunit SctE [Salmonella enterica]